jgi:two-component system sensor histidine kinase HydH
MNLALGLGRFFSGKDVTANTVQFDLLRWFSLVSILIITVVALGLGFIATRFVVNESIQRDAVLTAQFIQALASTEVARHLTLRWGNCSIHVRMRAFPLRNKPTVKMHVKNF